MKVYQGITQALVAEGTERLFGLMGSGNMDVVTDLWETHGVGMVAARHEQGGVAMADGYSRVTGRPGVCTVTEGPGLTQTGTALTLARFHRSPLVLVAADTPTRDRHHLQNFEQRPFAEATAGAFVPIRGPHTLTEDIQLAFRHARLGLGPVVLNAPVDIQDADLPSDWRYVPSSETIPASQQFEPDPEVLKRALNILTSASRPVVIAGRGCLPSGARSDIIELAERLGALLATTLQTAGYFHGEPWAVGIAGGFSASEVEDLIREADCVLALGASLNVLTTAYGRLFPNARVVQVDTEASRFGHATRAELAVLSDAGAFVRGVNLALSAQNPVAATGFRTSQVESVLAGVDQMAGPYEEMEDTIDPRLIVKAIDRMIPDSRTVVTDGGAFLGFPVTGMTLREPDGLVVSADFGVTGLGMPMAVGVAVGRPDRHTVAFLGDGGFMMSLQDLETAARHKIPLTVVIMNDGAYGSEVLHYLVKNQNYDLALFNNPDFAEVARAFGAAGASVRTVGELEALAPEIGKRDVPFLINAHTTWRVQHKFHRLFRKEADPAAS